MDYLGNWCGSTSSNRGNAYDWLRFWWDLKTNGGVSFATVAAVWDDSDPENWQKNDVTVTGKTLPATAFSNAASTNSISGTWAWVAAANGTHR